MKISVIVVSRNERAWLLRTVESIRETCPPDTEIIHIDDASDRREPDLSLFGAKQTILKTRIGAGRARALGMLKAREESDVLFTCDAHCLFGEGECLTALVEENQRFITKKALGKDYTPSPEECSLMLYPGKIEAVCKAAMEEDAISYLGPCRQGAATLGWENGFLRVRWMGLIPGVSTLSTAGIFGGNYAISRSAFSRIGGYPQLPGWFGFEEEALSIIAAACRVKIIAFLEGSPWHVFRSQGVDPIPCPYTTPEDRQLDNLAAVYRLGFSEEMWQKKWRPLLKTQILRGRTRPVPEFVLKRVEGKEFTKYRDILQERFEIKDNILIAAINHRMKMDSMALANEVVI